MTFDEWMQSAYETFGPDAMAVFDKYVLGEIDLNTFLSDMADAAINFHVQKKLKENTK